MWHTGFSKPEHLLMIAIIQQAYIDKDWDYFSRDAFRDHCEVLKVNHETIKEVILKRAAREGIYNG
jgi:hypothetical protein